MDVLFSTKHLLQSLRPEEEELSDGSDIAAQSQVSPGPQEVCSSDCKTSLYSSICKHVTYERLRRESVFQGPPRNFICIHSCISTGVLSAFLWRIYGRGESFFPAARDLQRGAGGGHRDTAKFQRRDKKNSH